MSQLPPEATHGSTAVTSPADVVPVLRISLSSQVDGGRNPKQLAVETYVPQDITKEALNELLDRIRQVVNRQTAAYELVTIEDHIDRVENQARIAREQVAKIDQRIKDRQEAGPKEGRRFVKVPDNELQNRQQLLDSVAGTLEQLKADKALKRRLEAIVYDHGFSDSSTADNASV